MEKRERPKGLESPLPGRRSLWKVLLGGKSIQGIMEPGEKPTRKSAQERLYDAAAPDAGETVTSSQMWQRAFSGDQDDAEGVSLSKCHNSTLRGAYVLEHAVSQWFASYGKERVVFMTLTLPGDNEPTRKETMRKWNVCRKSLLESGIVRGGLRVLERGERNGRWHLHVVAVLEAAWRHRGNYSWWKNPLGRWCVRNPGEELRRLWKALGKRCKACGFGRVEILPVRTDSKKAASYVASYLEKAKPDHGHKGRQRAWFGKERLTGICLTYGWSWAGGNGYIHRRWCRWAGILTKIPDIGQLNNWVKFTYRGAWGTVFDLVKRGKSWKVIIDLKDSIAAVRQACRNGDWLKTRNAAVDGVRIRKEGGRWFAKDGDFLWKKAFPEFAGDL